jgi:hypothetical protein
MPPLLDLPRTPEEIHGTLKPLFPDHIILVAQYEPDTDKHRPGRHYYTDLDDATLLHDLLRNDESPRDEVPHLYSSDGFCGPSLTFPADHLGHVLHLLALHDQKVLVHQAHTTWQTGRPHQLAEEVGDEIFDNPGDSDPRLVEHAQKRHEQLKKAALETGQPIITAQRGQTIPELGKMMLRPPERTYYGHRQNGRSTVWYVDPDGTWGYLNSRHDLARHSTTQFEWGYPGSGAAQLALGLLAAVTDQTTALAYYQQYKDKIIALLKCNHWEMSTSVILQHIQGLTMPITGDDRDEVVIVEGGLGTGVSS